MNAMDEATITINVRLGDCMHVLSVDEARALLNTLKMALGDGYPIVYPIVSSAPSWTYPPITLCGSSSYTVNSP